MRAIIAGLNQTHPLAGLSDRNTNSRGDYVARDRCMAPMNGIVEFPKSEISDQENARRIRLEVDRLTRLAPDEWRLWHKRSAQMLGITPEILRELIEAKLKNIKEEKRAAEAEKRRQEERVERQRTSAEREERRKHEKEQRHIEKDAQRKAKETTKAFADITKLPSERHEAKLSELAKRLDEDLETLRGEFSEYTGIVDKTGTPSVTWHVEPWPEPVATAALLRDLINKINQHFAARPHEVLTIALWIMMAWVHEIAATYSAILAATSAEPYSGKTTMLGVVSFQTPKPFSAVEATGPTIYRFVDREKPTFILDEADTIFKRKADINSIFNASWTRGTKIPRQVSINGVYVTVWFDPFCPKAIGVLGFNVPRALASRCIVIKTLPKRREDKQEFNHIDDEVFAELRRKLARWSADNAAALKDAKPLYPAGFNNRLQANWRLLLAIAELAGGQWSKQAREAAERISRTARKPSLGLQLLAAMQKMFAGRTEITSEEVVTQLRSDPDSIWVDYRGKGQITQRQVADLLEQYDIIPHPLHPTKRKSFARRGYKLAQFVDVFARYQASDPIIRSSRRKKR